MVEESTDKINSRIFRVISIEKSDSPEGITGEEWYQYVINQGLSSMTGKRPGTLKSVTEYVEEFVDNLNQRTTPGYSAHAVRKQGKLEK